LTTAILRPELRATFSGRVVEAGDPGYDTARRVWNGAIDRHPAVIVRCEDEHDVVAAVRTAHDQDLPLSVRGGGHDWAGRAVREGGLVIDLSAMRGVIVDPETRTAVARGGATVGDVVAAASRHGLAPVTGTARAVGMAGLTLGGGYGLLAGKHGLAIDNLVDADVVLANGRRVSASQDDDADLYWALRGGGGNFGVVTTARYRLHPLPSVHAGRVLFPIAQAAAVLTGYRELIANAPDELTVMAGLVAGPDGLPLVFLFPTWSGDRAMGERFMADVGRLGTPVLSQIGHVAYEDALRMFDAHVVNGRHCVVRTQSLPALTDDALSLVVDAARRMTSRFSLVLINHFHGAASRVPTRDTAFAMRENHFMVVIISAWEPSTARDAAAHERWADTLSGGLSFSAWPGGYANVLGPDELERVLQTYGPHVERLRALKQRFDPEGVFTSAAGHF
jgi:FAD/FMN-containing dehydrogenase